MALDDKDRALDALESAYEDQAPGLLFLAVDSRFKPLHSEPRFENLILRMHLPTTAHVLSQKN